MQFSASHRFFALNFQERLKSVGNSGNIVLKVIGKQVKILCGHAAVNAV